MKCRFLIIGNGFMAQRFRGFLPHSEIYSGRITGEAAELRAIVKISPEFIINCAGKTGRPTVDWCESHKLETLQSNLGVPLRLLDIATHAGSTLVHISSGCLYETPTGAAQATSFTEDDAPNFFGSYYSRTKIAAEAALREFDVLQLRLRMPLDVVPNERNLLTKLLSYCKVVDAANSISVIDDFLRAALALMERKAVGIFNLVNPGAISHRELLDIYQAVSGKRLSVEFISAPELDQLTRARRSNCVLSTAKLEAIGIAMPEVKQAVRHCIESYVDAEARESFRRAA